MTQTLFEKFLRHEARTRFRARDNVLFGSGANEAAPMELYGRLRVLQGIVEVQVGQAVIAEFHRTGRDATGSSLIRHSITGAIPQGEPPTWTILNRESIYYGMVAKNAWAIGGTGNLDSGGERWMEIHGADTLSVEGPHVGIRNRRLFMRGSAAKIEWNHATAAKNTIQGLLDMLSSSEKVEVYDKMSLGPSGTAQATTTFRVGTHIAVVSDSNHNRNSSQTVRVSDDHNAEFKIGGTGDALVGTWRQRGRIKDTSPFVYIFERVD